MRIVQSRSPCEGKKPSAPGPKEGLLEDELLELTKKSKQHFHEGKNSRVQRR